MHPEMEALLRSYDAFDLARGGDNEQRLFALYRAGSEETAAARAMDKELLDRCVRKMHPRWVRASSKPSTLPPRPSIIGACWPRACPC